MKKQNYPFKKFKLKNNLTVLLYKMPSVKSVYAISYIRTGSTFENENERGISHFTEHMSFLKTKKFKKSLDITQYAQQNGMNYGATTHRRKTRYWSVFPNSNYKKGIGFLHELIFNPVITKQEVEKEKGVILSEYNDFWHNPDRRFSHMTLVNRFKQKEHPYSYRPLGIPETIKNIDKSAILKWRNEYFNPSNMYLSLAGNIDYDEVLKEIKKTFGAEEKGKEHKEPKFKTTDYSDFDIYLQEDKRPQIKFFVSFPAFGTGEVDREKLIKLNLLRYIIGGSSASRMAQELRENKRYVYSISAGTQLLKWMGEFYIHGAVSGEKLTKTLKLIKKEIEKIKKNGVKDEEIKYSNKYLNASTLMRFDSPSSIALYFIGQAYYRRKIWYPEDYIKVANKTTKEDLNKISKEIFDFSKVNISLLGDVKKKQIEDIKKIYKK